MKALFLPLLMVAMSASAQMLPESLELNRPELATGALLIAGIIALVVARRLAK
jgi:hypothetical protein